MAWIRRFLAVLGIISIPGGASADSILTDVERGATTGANALQGLGYRADFTFDSIESLEKFLKANVRPDGGVIDGSELARETGKKVFVLGCYLGETIRRHVQGKWIGDDSDPEAEINVSVEFVSEAGERIQLWPIQRVVKRVLNGEENNVWDYARLMIAENDAGPSQEE